MPLARFGANITRTPDGSLAGSCDCDCGGNPAVFLQARACWGDADPINLFRNRAEFAPWGGPIPLPYHFIDGSGVCGFFSSTSPQTETPGQILVGETMIANCGDSRCGPEIYVQSRRCPGGELRAVWRKQSDFAPWGGFLPWPYYWTVVQQGACGFFDDTCPTTTTPGALLVNDTQIPDCSWPGCDDPDPILCGQPPRCPSTYTAIISGSGSDTLDGPHGMIWNGSFWVWDSNPPPTAFVRLSCAQIGGAETLWTLDCSHDEGNGCFAVATKQWGLPCAPPGVYTLIGATGCDNVTLSLSG